MKHYLFKYCSPRSVDRYGLQVMLCFKVKLKAFCEAKFKSTSLGIQIPDVCSVTEVHGGCKKKVRAVFHIIYCFLCWVV